MKTNAVSARVCAAGSRTVFVLLALVVALTGSAALATPYHLVPSDADLGDLDHTLYYTWGVNRPWTSTERAVGATLSFSGIYNWDNSPNVLYIHLFDSATLGVKTKTDSEGNGDAFAGQGISLVTYRNLSTHAQNLLYTLTADQVATLNTYAADGRIGLGFDPDCHFYNSGVALDITTTPGVPEPATLALLAAAGPMIALKRRRD